MYDEPSFRMSESADGRMARVRTAQPESAVRLIAYFVNYTKMKVVNKGFSIILRIVHIFMHFYSAGEEG